MPVCVRFIPEAFDPAWPPITPIAPAFPAAFRKSPKMANRESTFFFGTPCITTSTIFPERREAFLTSSSMLKRFAVTTSPSAPPAGVDPVQPIASTCSARRIGSSNSPCAVPCVHPRQSWYFSECTFSRPMAFIFATPHSSALLSAGDPVTREPMSSLSSVRYWNARESIIPSPAIFTSAGFVPSSSGPLGAGRLSARAVHAPPKQNPIATTVTATNRRRICSLLAPLAQSNSITHSDAFAAIRFLWSAGAPLPLFRQHKANFYSRHHRATPFRFRLYHARCPPYTASEAILRLPFRFHPLFRAFALICLLPSVFISFTQARQIPQKPVEKHDAKTPAPAEPQQNPYQIELLETRYRFEANGDSRKE